MEKKFDLQLFADEVADSEPKTPESNENATNTEESNTSEQDNTEFEDGASKENAKPTEDTSNKEDTTKNEVKAEDTKKKNAEAAQRRIAERQKKQEEARKKELEAEKRKSYIEGFKKSSNGTNKFTGKPIEDEDDVEEYELMLRLEKEGKDPIDDYHEAVKAQKRAERQKALEAEQAEKKAKDDMDNDVNDFVKKFGAETANNLFNDKKFVKYADKKLGKIPLTDIYQDYLDIQSMIETESDRKAMEKDARRTSSSGSLGKNNETPKSITDLSPEDFHRLNLEIASRR